MLPWTNRRAWLAALALALAAAAAMVFFKSTPQRPYEPLIPLLRAQNIAPGQTREFFWDSTSLRPYDSPTRPPRGHGTGHIWARVLPAGSLQVVIETRDLGHAGEYGIAYTDQPMTPTPAAGGWFTLDLPGHLNLVQPDMQIDQHWWRVVHNLD